MTHIGIYVLVLLMKLDCVAFFTSASQEIPEEVVRLIQNVNQHLQVKLHEHLQALFRHR